MELHKKTIEEIRNKVEHRKYYDMIKEDMPKTGLFGAWKGEIKDYSESMAFGTSFITLMFLGFVLGYYIGKFAFGLEETQCWVCSIIIGILSFMLETILYIFKVEKGRYNRDNKKKSTSIGVAAGNIKFKLE